MAEVQCTPATFGQWQDIGGGISVTTYGSDPAGTVWDDDGNLPAVTHWIDPFYLAQNAGTWLQLAEGIEVMVLASDPLNTIRVRGTRA